MWRPIIYTRVYPYAHMRVLVCQSLIQYFWRAGIDLEDEEPSMALTSAIDVYPEERGRQAPAVKGQR